VIELHQKRIMRDGTIVKVLDIVWKHDEYWKRDMPYVVLELPGGERIERRYPTVESYPLLDSVNR
jgi:hypothetical protein